MAARDARAGAAAFVNPAAILGVKRQAVAVAQGAGPVALPRLAPIGAAHDRAGLNAHDDDPRVAWRQCDGLYVGREGGLGWGEPPERTHPAETLQLGPTRPAVARDEYQRRFRAGVDNAWLAGAGGDRFDNLPRQASGPPGCAAIFRPPDPAALGAGVDDAGVQRVG